jgi:hypothetical protein
VRRDDGHGMVVKVNGCGRWSSDGVVLWRVRRQNGDAVEWWGEWQGWDDIFIAVEGRNRMVQGGWPTMVVRIQCFNLVSRGEATGGSIAGRWSGGSELVLAQWEGSMIRRNGMVTLAGGEAAQERAKGGDEPSWATNITEPENEENSHGRFNCYKWTVKI